MALMVHKLLQPGMGTGRPGVLGEPPRLCTPPPRWGARLCGHSAWRAERSRQPQDSGANWAGGVEEGVTGWRWRWR